MKRTLTSLIIGALLMGALGCSGGSNSSPAGPEANSGKTYTRDDANSAQPVRGGSDTK